MAATYKHLGADFTVADIAKQPFEKFNKWAKSTGLYSWLNENDRDIAIKHVHDHCNPPKKKEETI